MILILSICEEELHELEFVKPIADILRKKGIKFRIGHYKKIKQNDLREAKKVIICGTSLQDNGFLENIGKFSWIKTFSKPLLGICGGMEVIALSYRCTLSKKRQIGVIKMTLKQELLGMPNRTVIDGYNLHGLYVNVNRRDFESLAYNRCSQIIKHRRRPIYGLMFHPEVRNKEIIENFVK